MLSAVPNLPKFVYQHKISLYTTNVEMSQKCWHGHGKGHLLFWGSFLQFLGMPTLGREQFVLSHNKKHEIIYEQPLMGQWGYNLRILLTFMDLIYKFLNAWKSIAAIYSPQMQFHYSWQDWCMFHQMSHCFSKFEVWPAHNLYLYFSTICIGLVAVKIQALTKPYVLKTPVITIFHQWESG